MSRGDRSGTHAAELNRGRRLASTSPVPTRGSVVSRDGRGMGATLKLASAMNAYVLADRGTWLSFKNRGELGIVIEGDKRLFNQYAAILVNPDKHAQRQAGSGSGFHRLAGFVRRPEGDRRLQDRGLQPFFPDATAPGVLNPRVAVRCTREDIRTGGRGLCFASTSIPAGGSGRGRSHSWRRSGRQGR